MISVHTSNHQAAEAQSASGVCCCVSEKHSFCDVACCLCETFLVYFLRIGETLEQQMVQTSTES